MPVPANIYVIRRLHLIPGLALLVFLFVAPAFARGPEPALRIPLESIGFQPQPAQFLLAGSSMLTLDYVDSQHLLLTFGVHRLMKRIADDPPDDEDRMVEAVLLEVPSGRVLARADWRFHDNGQYLWNLDHGRFLLRTRDTLTTFAPLANLASGHAFRQRPLLGTKRHIGAVLVSPEADLLIIESVEQMPPVSPPATPLFGPAPKSTPAPLGRPGESDPVALSFYRLSMPKENGEEVIASVAGVARSVTFGGLPATGIGHLAVVDEGRQEWAFDFHPYGGKVKELAPFGSTCRPKPQFVSNSEFVSFGCHSGNSPQVLGGFNMRGEEMWEQNLFGEFVASSFAFSPSSGRFALGRVLGTPFPDGSAPIIPEAFTSQSVVVYQTETGKQILHVDCSPIARAGQNFALSPDGMELAVIRENAIQIYSLPPLSATDQADVKEARALIPEQTTLAVDFSEPSPDTAAATQEIESSPSVPENSDSTASKPGLPKQDSPKPDSPDASMAASVPAATPGAAEAPKPSASSVPAADAAPEEPRKPPTLYTLPADSADHESK